MPIHAARACHRDPGPQGLARVATNRQPETCRPGARSVRWRITRGRRHGRSKMAPTKLLRLGPVCRGDLGTRTRIARLRRAGPRTIQTLTGPDSDPEKKSNWYPSSESCRISPSQPVARCRAPSPLAAAAESIHLQPGRPGLTISPVAFRRLAAAEAESCIMIP